MTDFATTACKVARHVRISDETGAAGGTGHFNQENVPSETHPKRFTTKEGESE